MPRLSLRELEDFDDRAPMWYKKERRFCCPLEECSDHRVDAAHRSLSVNTEVGSWYCHRCGQSGLLTEYVKKADPFAVYSEADMDKVFDQVLDQVRLRDEARGESVD